MGCRTRLSPSPGLEREFTRLRGKSIKDLQRKVFRGRKASPYKAGRKSDAEKMRNGLEAKPKHSIMFSYIPSKLINSIFEIILYERT